MKIIYRSQHDAVEFDMKKYKTSLNKYDPSITEADIDKALSELTYDPMHVTVLIHTGANLIKDETQARAYFEEHNKYNDLCGMERLRRITGYLVGSLERWNDGKKAEEKARVKHSVGKYERDGQFSQEQKDSIEAVKLENSVMSQF